MDVENFLKEIEQKGLLASKDSSKGSSQKKDAQTDVSQSNGGDKTKVTGDSKDSNAKSLDNGMSQNAQAHSETQPTVNARPIRKLTSKTEGVEDLLTRSFQVR